MYLINQPHNVCTSSKKNPSQKNSSSNELIKIMYNPIQTIFAVVIAAALLSCATISSIGRKSLKSRNAPAYIAENKSPQPSACVIDFLNFTKEKSCVIAVFHDLL